MKTSELIASVIQKGAIPETQNTFTEADFIKILNEEMELTLVPKLMRAKEDYLLFEQYLPLVPQRNHYRIPYRAVGGSLRDLQLIDSAGNYYEMSRTIIDDRWAQSNESNTVSTYNRIYTFYVKNNQVVLLGNYTNTAASNVIMIFYIKPNKLVMEDRCGFITNIEPGIDITGASNPLVTTFTLDNLPLNMVTGKLDFLMGQPIYSMIKYDLVPTAVDSTTKKIQFLNTEIATSMAYDIGDYFASAQECCIPQIPEEMQTMLTHIAAARCLEALGDQAGLQSLDKKVASYQDNLYDVIGDRVEGAPLKIINRNGFMRRGRGFGGR